jgi:hypothetical protein
MSEGGLSFNPDDVRRQIQLERQTAAERLEQAKPPTPWLENFEDNYGKLARPVQKALVKYYKARKEAFNHLADQHESMADGLARFLEMMDQTDAEGASKIRSVFGDGPLGPLGPSWPGTLAGLPDGSTPHVGALNGSTPTEPVTGTNGTAGGRDPLGGGQGPLSPTDGQPASQGQARPGEAAPPLAPPDAPRTFETPTPVVDSPGQVAGAPIAPPDAPRTFETPTPVVDSPGQVAGAPIAPAMFPGAVPAAQRRTSDTSDLGELDEFDDLLLARTLLAAILAAVSAGGARQSMAGVDWSVSVMRGPAGAAVFLTTNEGRGWVPAGLFLPRQVSLPPLSAVADADWEDIADPARVLVEFGRVWGAASGARLTALVSSTGITDELRALLDSSVGVEANVGPESSDLDLAVAGPGLVDRLAAMGANTADVPDDQVVARCVRLAADAHSQVVRTAGAELEWAVPEVAAARGLRQKICATAQAGGEVPEQAWRDLWTADAAIKATMAARRSQVGDVSVGGMRPGRDDVAAQLLLERRCNEMALLLTGGASQQTLRDVTYSQRQLLDHPQFAPAPVAAEARDRAVVATPEGAVPPPVSPPAASAWTATPEDQAGRT